MRNASFSHLSRRLPLPPSGPLAPTPDGPEAFIALAAADSRLGRHQEALEACREAIQLNPRHPEAHLGLATVLLMTGDYEAAAASFRTAIILKPDLL